MLKSEALVLVAQFPDNEFSNIFRKHRNARIGEAKKNQQVGTTRTNNRFRWKRNQPLCVKVRVSVQGPRNIQIELDCHQFRSPVTHQLDHSCTFCRNQPFIDLGHSSQYRLAIEQWFVPKERHPGRFTKVEKWWKVTKEFHVQENEKRPRSIRLASWMEPHRKPRGHLRSMRQHSAQVAGNRLNKAAQRAGLFFLRSQTWARFIGGMDPDWWVVSDETSKHFQRHVAQILSKFHKISQISANIWWFLLILHDFVEFR